MSKYYQEAMLKAIVFDMDGVIVDSEPLHKKVQQTLLARYGIEPTEEELQNYVGLGIKPLLERHIQKYHLPVALEDLHLLYLETLFQIFTNGELIPIPGAVELIRQGKNAGLKLGIASSSPLKLIHLILNRLQIIQHFDSIVSGDQVEKGKPDPEIFLESAKRLHCEPFECVVIEDSTNGIIAAKKAHMKCVAFISPNTKGQKFDLADWIVDDLCKISIEKMKKWFDSVDTY